MRGYIKLRSTKAERLKRHQEEIRTFFIWLNALLLFLIVMMSMAFWLMSLYMGE